MLVYLEAYYVMLEDARPPSQPARLPAAREEAALEPCWGCPPEECSQGV